MSKGDIFENDILNLIFKGVAIANIADNAASAPLTNLFYSLHTADVGEAGVQTTNEVAYTGYARAAVSRGAGFTVTGNSVSPAATVNFPQCTAGSATATHFAIGTLVSGAGKVLYKGPLGAPLGPFTGAVSGNTITIPGLTGLAVNDRIAFYPAVGSTLPTGITEGVAYFVISVAADVITVSATQAGAVITLSASGDGSVFKVTPIAIAVNVTPQFTTASAITED